MISKDKYLKAHTKRVRSLAIAPNGNFFSVSESDVFYGINNKNKNFSLIIIFDQIKKINKYEEYIISSSIQALGHRDWLCY